MKNTSATDPNSGTSRRRPSRLRTSCTGVTVALMPWSAESDCARPAESAVISVCAPVSVAPSRSRAMAFPAPEVGRDSSGVTPNQKSTYAFRS
jgi:hypothetical protein